MHCKALLKECLCFFCLQKYLSWGCSFILFRRKKEEEYRFCYNSNIRGMALPRLFPSTVFGWSMIHGPFPHLHSSTYLISHTPDPFKLHTNTLNYLDISFNSPFRYSLTLPQCSVVFQSLLVSSAHLLIHFPILWKHLLSTLTLFQFGLSILNCFWLLKYHHSLLM